MSHNVRVKTAGYIIIIVFIAGYWAVRLRKAPSPSQSVSQTNAAVVAERKRPDPPNAPSSKELTEAEILENRIKELEQSVYSTNQFLKTVEKYRSAPAEWIDSKHSQSAQQMENFFHAQDANERSRLAVPRQQLAALANAKILHEFGANTNYSRLIRESLDISFAMDPDASVTSQVDQIIGSGTDQSTSPSARDSERAMSDLKTRQDAITNTINRILIDNGIPLSIYEALYRKQQVSVLQDMCDIYIGKHLPVELYQSRRKLEQIQ